MLPHRHDNVDFVQMMIRNNNLKQRKQEMNDNRRNLQIAQESAEQNRIRSNYYSKFSNSDNLDYLDFKKNVKESLLVEALNILALASLNPAYRSEEYDRDLTRQLVSNFVHQEGADNLLNSFKHKSYFLSELAYVCNKHIDAITEKASSGSKDSFRITPKEKESFYGDLNKVNAEKVTNTIKNRVMDSIEDFTYSNIRAKEQIKSIINKTKDKVDGVNSPNSKLSSENKDSITESYANLAKKDIADIKTNKIQNVFECMVYNMSRAALTNGDLNQVFVENAALNMDKVVEHCEVMYNFLTMIDTAKIKTIDEQYISDMLHDMKSL